MAGNVHITAHEAKNEKLNIEAFMIVLLLELYFDVEKCRCIFAAYCAAIILDEWQFGERAKYARLLLPRRVSAEENASCAMVADDSFDPLVRHPEKSVRKIERDIFADESFLCLVPHPKSAKMCVSILAVRNSGKSGLNFENGLDFFALNVLENIALEIANAAEKYIFRTC